QTRKDIQRLQKELGEMVELQFGLIVSLAELQAEMKVQQSVAADEAEARASSEADRAGGSRRDGERRRLRPLALDHELRGVMENLRAMAAQKRNETDQLVVQLRSLRAQQRQMAAETERSKQEPKPNQ